MTELAFVGDVPTEALRYKSEIQFRRLLEKLPVGAYTCDPDGLITYYNQQAVKLWGRAPALNDAVDRFCGSFKLYAADGAPIDHDRCWMALALRDDREYKGQEIIIERPDGTRLTVLAHANPIHDDNGKLIGAVNVLVDITDRKRVEVAREQAERRKDEFLATLSHELRNPLAPLRMVSEIVRANGSGNSRLQWASGLIERQVKHLARLVDDLLDLSRITTSEVTLVTAPADLRDIVWQAVEMNRAAVEAKRHNLWVDIPERRYILDCDSARLVQVVSNLLSNAIKYTGRGGSIHIAASTEGTHVALRVRDNGAGISADVLPYVFDMFVQGKQTVARSEGGLGIGLTLARRIVALHGGDVTAASDGPGKGSEFTVRLPLVGRVHMSDEHAASKRPIALAPTRRVLIADDNPDITESLAILLRQYGHEVRTAADGAEALRIAHEFLPDTAVLDLGLPQQDGWAVARALREDPRHKHALLVALSGYGQAEHRESSRTAGFDHHLVKPIDTEELQALFVSSPLSNA
ncbi:MAG: ATP-binding protein [Gammaproteobacteria bacterium]